MNVTLLPAPQLPAGRPRLVVAGFMATGKTAAGRLAAARLGLPFLDLDELVSRRAGASVAEIFETEGEEGFREREQTVVTEASRLSACVVATGGGAVLDRASFGPLAEGSVVAVLTAEAPEVARRVRGTDRPLLADDPEGRARALLAERTEAYAAAGDPLDTSALTPEETAAALEARYPRQGGLRLAVGTSEVLISAGALDGLGEEVVRALPSAAAAAVCADGSVARTLGARVAAQVQAAGLSTTLIPLPAGEASKAVATVESLWRDFLDHGLTRGDVVVAVGGGATLDVAGFAAATYMRGVAHVNVPTTLLAMVDAALGGKTGIDVGAAKNLAGVFHDPRLVVVDPGLLETLPPNARAHGLAEAVKAFVLAAPLALDALQDDPPVEWVVEQAVRVKAAYVAGDHLDRGLRASLNLGHTFGHAIESASAYSVAHGEAVSAGLVAAARLGEEFGVTPPGLAHRLESLLGRLGLPASAPPGLSADDLAAAMRWDKKRRGPGTIFVVPAPGGAALVEGISPSVAVEAMRA